MHGRLCDKTSLQVTVNGLQITFQSEGCVAAQEWGINCGCRGMEFWHDYRIYCGMLKNEREAG